MCACVATCCWPGVKAGDEACCKPAEPGLGVRAGKVVVVPVDPRGAKDSGGWVVVPNAARCGLGWRARRAESNGDASLLCMENRRSISSTGKLMSTLNIAWGKEDVWGGIQNH